jgi:uncharacterized protein (TIGR03067 family)
MDELMDIAFRLFVVSASFIVGASPVFVRSPDYNADLFTLAPIRKPHGQPEPQAIQPDAKSLQGFWQMAEWFDYNGTRAPDDEAKGHVCEFKGNSFIKHLRGTELPASNFTVDASKTPAWIDIDYESRNSVPMRGICKIEGDQLTICVNVGIRGNEPPERPTEFRTNLRNFHAVWVFKKVMK